MIDIVEIDLDEELDSSPEFLKHCNGNGLVLSTAFVDKTSFVGPDAFAGGYSRIIGNVRLEGNSKALESPLISGRTRLLGKAIIKGKAVVCGNHTISESVIVDGRAELSGSVHLSGNTSVRDRAKISGEIVISGNTICEENAVVSGKVKLNNCLVTSSLVLPDHLNLSLSDAVVTSPAHVFYNHEVVIIAVNNGMYINNVCYSYEDLVWLTIVENEPGDDFSKTLNKYAYVARSIAAPYIDERGA